VFARVKVNDHIEGSTTLVEAFETAVEEKRTTSPLWGIIIGCAALAQTSLAAPPSP